MKLYAVLTGDVAGSSRFEGDDRKILLDALKNAFLETEKILGPEVIAFPFDIFRGDSFQGVLQNPDQALQVAIIIRAIIRSSFKTTLREAVDARISIGIGTISHLPSKNSGEGDGDAYRFSGPELDKMSKHSRMILITTPWPNINQELDVECAMLDTIISRWTIEQAQVVPEFFKGKTQEEMASKFNISQPAVKKRISSASIFQIELLVNRYKSFFNVSNL